MKSEDLKNLFRHCFDLSIKEIKESEEKIEEPNPELLKLNFDIKTKNKYYSLKINCVENKSEVEIIIENEFYNDPIYEKKLNIESIDVESILNNVF